MQTERQKDQRYEFVDRRRNKTGITGSGMNMQTERQMIQWYEYVDRKTDDTKGCVCRQKDG